MSPVQLWFERALLPEGWARQVRFRFDGGSAPAVEAGVAKDPADEVHAFAVPGLGNLHSHAFQRAMAGLTEVAGPSGDNFWSWREAMYRFAGRIAPEDLEAIAAQAYVEMLESGFTRVGEFHYLHRAPDGGAYADPAEMSARIAAAASATGIGLTLLPVFYAHSGFGRTAPGTAQRRFVQSLDEYVALMMRCREHLEPLPDAVLGIAPHSLRAVTPEELAAVVAMADAAWPIHIHAAEQAREVADSIAWSGARPVQWLLDHAAVDARWCVVHATHLVADELLRLAATGAVVGLASTTEADLGDGTFAARKWLDAGGAYGVGTDSNTIVDPFAELRQLEWSQRIAQGARNVLCDGDDPVGQSLWGGAAKGGSRAAARSAGAIAVGARADLVVLDADDPALSGLSAEAWVDAAVFGPCRRPVRDVMVAGSWVVRDGRHPREGELNARYRGAMRRLGVA